MNQTKIDALVDSNDILALFETRGHKYEQLKGNPRVLESFYSFVLRVFVTQKEDQQKKPAVGFGVKAPEALPIDYKLINMALRSVLKSSQSIYFEETTILSALRSLKLESADTDFLLGLIGEQPGKRLINIKIELFKNQQAYV